MGFKKKIRKAEKAISKVGAIDSSLLNVKQRRHLYFALCAMDTPIEAAKEEVEAVIGDNEGWDEDNEKGRVPNRDSEKMATKFEQQSNEKLPT